MITGTDGSVGLKILKKIVFPLIVSSFMLLVFFYFYHHDRLYSVIEGRVYRSAQLSGDDLEKTIKEKGIKTIINLRGRWDDNDWYKREKEIAVQYNIRLYDIQLSPHDLPEFDKLRSLLDVLMNEKKPVLIHCYRGADRTGLISAIALIIEKDPPLSLVKKQFSFRYGIMPFYRSIGPYFFEGYEQWLEKNRKTHEKKLFFYWIENEYLDGQGNLKYWIDNINNKMFDENNRVLIKGDTKEISIKGWAFDSKMNRPTDGLLYVFIDNQLSDKVFFKYNRPDVARYFKLGEKYYGDFQVGWESKFSSDKLSDGCHPLNLKFVRDASSVWEIDTDFQLCMNHID
jgi:undecaprenyl-diphosphatase